MSAAGMSAAWLMILRPMTIKAMVVNQPVFQLIIRPTLSIRILVTRTIQQLQRPIRARAMHAIHNDRNRSCLARATLPKATDTTIMYVAGILISGQTT